MRRLIVLIAALALLATACGGGSDSSPTTTAAPDTTAAPTTTAAPDAGTTDGGTGTTDGADVPVEFRELIKQAFGVDDATVQCLIDEFGDENMSGIDVTALPDGLCGLDFLAVLQGVQNMAVPPAGAGG